MQEAKGQTSRFLRVYEEYAKAPDVTRKRIYLETLERVLGRSDKTILDSGPGGNGVLPFLNLNEPSRRANPPAAAATTGGPR